MGAGVGPAESITPTLDELWRWPGPSLPRYHSCERDPALRLRSQPWTGLLCPALMPPDRRTSLSIKPEAPMRTVQLASGQSLPVMGQGTWRMGEDPARREQEGAAIRLGVELGMTLIDTAEMYGDGATESFLGEALRGLRDRVQLVSKACPQNAGRGRLERACEASLRRLRTDRLDLYLLHWRGGVPLPETVEGMEALVVAGKIGAWGVSNFDTADMQELQPAGGSGCVANQVLCNVTRRGPEFDLLPALAAQDVLAMAYSPVEQGRLPAAGAMAEVAARHGCSAY